MNNIFGTVPYRGGNYGSVEELNVTTCEVEELSALTSMLVEFKHGKFDRLNELEMMMGHPNYDVRQYCHQLMAHTCNHKNVFSFRRALEMSSSIEETQRILLRLGETLSLNAVSIVLDFIDETDDDELYFYAAMALENLLSITIEETDFQTKDVRSICTVMIKDLNSEYYYYRGRPIFPGDVTKQLIILVTSAYGEKKPLILIEDAEILANFSGVECPVKNRMMMHDEEMKALMDYVKIIASIPWKKGSKYFYRNLIE